MRDKDNVALVTGAAGVLGRAISRGLKDDGYRVVLVDLDERRLGELASEIGGNAVGLRLDVGRPRDVASVCARIRSEFGRVSVLVNNAGVLSNSKLNDTSDEEWRRIMSANLDGAFYLCRELLPDMKKSRWGRIVNISSLAMKTGGLTAGTTYTVSKGGLTALTLSIAREAAPFGVTANGIAPAYVKTPMITDFLSESQRQELIKQIPVRRFCEAEEVAHVVRFLVSPLSGFITGEIIDINGGLHMD